MFIQVERARQFLQLRDKLANSEREESTDPTERELCPRSASLTNLLPLSRDPIQTSYSANDLLDIQSDKTSVTDIRQATEVAAGAIVDSQSKSEGDMAAVSSDIQRQQDLARKAIL